MDSEKQISGLCKLAGFLHDFLVTNPENYSPEERELSEALIKSEIENPWFTVENQRFALRQWAKILTEENLREWLSNYTPAKTAKRVGLILAGNIPMVGFHDVLSVILSRHIAVIKLSSKDRQLIPFLLKKWQGFSENNIAFEYVEKLQDFDAVIATGSNNTARYLEYYFKDHLSVIRKNRTSVAVLSGNESPRELQLLAEDIFRYYGLGCRNVTRLFLPYDFNIDRLFESFINFKDVINHHKYANNYEYNRAIYLLNQVRFWDNNFVLLKEDEHLFSPLAVLNFSRYHELDEVQNFIKENQNDIQAIVATSELRLDSVGFGDTQHPGLDTYADDVDTMRFLEII